jgi:hypothetical protein
MRSMQRRVTAWFTLLAILFGLAMPAHAYAHLARAGDKGTDFCTTSETAKPAPGAPASETLAACDACCGCTGGVVPASSAIHAAPAAAHGAVTGQVQDALAASTLRLSLARGPPGNT